MYPSVCSRPDTGSTIDDPLSICEPFVPLDEGEPLG